MIISLDTGSSIPIYVQLRNQIVTGIGKGELKEGERLPTVRQLAEDAGVNTMTVNKTYQLLKMEGFITIDRRRGLPYRRCGNGMRSTGKNWRRRLEALSAEARMKGMDRAEFLKLCEQVFSGMHPISPELF